MGKELRGMNITAVTLLFCEFCVLIFNDSLQMYIMKIRKEGVEWSNLHTKFKLRTKNKML